MLLWTCLPWRFTVMLSVLEHLGSNLNGRSGDRDDGALFVQELSGEEADIAAASHYASPPEQATWPGRPEELDMQVCGRGKVTGMKPGNQRGS
jgi:hypothetical protein